jgi:hypothetical protein
MNTAERVQLSEREAGRAPESLRGLTRILDEAIRIPGTNIRLGLDALLGLIPGGGDVATGILSALVIVQSARLGAPSSVLARMVGTVVIDVAVGSIPLLGDLFDVAFRANSKNLRLLESWLDRPTGTRRASRMSVAAALLALVIAIALAVWGAIALGGAILDSIDSD